MKLIERHLYYIANPKPISQAAIAEARFAFTGRFGGRHPHQIRLSARALNEMCAEIGVEQIPANFTNESVQGMLITPDPTLADGEWIVGSTDERISDVKE